MKSNRWSYVIPVMFVTVVSAATLAFGQSANGSVYAKDTIKVSLRISTCPTTYGGPEGEGKTPKTVIVEVPTALQHDLAFYTDSKRTLPPLLAPRGWHCSAGVGADGSASLRVYPTKTAPVETKASSAEEVTATSDGACQGCVADDVCPYFTNAETQIGYTGMNCNTTKPSDEQDDYVTGSNTADHGQVDTYDPVTRKDRYPKYGVLRYLDVPGAEAEDVHETCALPRKDSSWCKAITSEFVKENWEFSRLSAPATTTTTGQNEASVACTSAALLAGLPATDSTNATVEESPTCLDGYAELWVDYPGSRAGVFIFESQGDSWRTLGLEADVCGFGTAPSVTLPIAVGQAVCDPSYGSTTTTTNPISAPTASTPTTDPEITTINDLAAPPGQGEPWVAAPQALINAIVQSAANNVNGGYSFPSGTTFWMSEDANAPQWFFVFVAAPQNDESTSGSGIEEEVNGAWTIASAVGSNPGCTGSDGQTLPVGTSNVPTNVLEDFRIVCGQF